MDPIEVFDARICYGTKFLQAPPIHSLSEQLRLADAKRAVVVFEELAYLPPQRSIGIVNDYCSSTEVAYGLYLLLSALTGEMPPVSELCRSFKAHRIAGFYLHQDGYNVPYDPIMFRDELNECEARHIPVFYHRDSTNTFEYLCQVLERHPALRVVLSVDEEWPNARKIYPLMKAYSGVYLCLSEHVWMGALEDLVGKFGSQRLLYSSSYPARYAGGTVMMVQNANITDSDRENIFTKNMEALIGGMRCD